MPYTVDNPVIQIINVEVMNHLPTSLTNFQAQKKFLYQND